MHIDRDDAVGNALQYAVEIVLDLAYLGYLEIELAVLALELLVQLSELRLQDVVGVLKLHGALVESLQHLGQIFRRLYFHPV